jgi:hypothetical protein
MYPSSFFPFFLFSLLTTCSLPDAQYLYCKLPYYDEYEKISVKKFHKEILELRDGERDEHVILIQIPNSLTK